MAVLSGTSAHTPDEAYARAHASSTARTYAYELYYQVRCPNNAMWWFL